MSALPVKKIYVDSRYMTNDSTSTSNFKFQLARNIFMPQNSLLPRGRLHTTLLAHRRNRLQRHDIHPLV